MLLDGQLLSPMTPDQLEASRFFLERLAGQSFMVVLLVTGIYIVGRLLLKAHDGRIADLKERLDDHRARISANEKKLQECEDDRRKLWQHLACNPPKPAG